MRIETPFHSIRLEFSFRSSNSFHLDLMMNIGFIINNTWVELNLFVEMRHLTVTVPAGNTLKISILYPPIVPPPPRDEWILTGVGTVRGGAKFKKRAVVVATAQATTTTTTTGALSLLQS